MEPSWPPGSDSPIAAFIAANWDDADSWLAVRRRLRRLKGRQAVLIESPEVPAPLLAWLAAEAPETAVQALVAPDARFRGCAARSTPWTPDAAAQAVQQVLSSSLRGALVALSAFDEDGAARLAVAAYVRLPPESSARRLLDGLLHRLTHAFHGHRR